MAQTNVLSTGRRKVAAARVMIRPGSGKITVNKKDAGDYFKRKTLLMVICQPFEITSTSNLYDVTATVSGGGLAGQAGAVRHGITRALVRENPDYRSLLRKSGMLTRDSRMVERKKPGQSGARKRYQFSKR